MPLRGLQKGTGCCHFGVKHGFGSAVGVVAPSLFRPAIPDWPFAFSPHRGLARLLSRAANEAVASQYFRTPDIMQAQNPSGADTECSLPSLHVPVYSPVYFLSRQYNEPHLCSLSTCRRSKPWNGSMVRADPMLLPGCRSRCSLTVGARWIPHTYAGNSIDGLALRPPMPKLRRRGARNRKHRQAACCRSHLGLGERFSVPSESVQLAPELLGSWPPPAARAPKMAVGSAEAARKRKAEWRPQDLGSSVSDPKRS